METKSDLLVAIKCLETGIYGAYENVLINSKYFNEYDEKVSFSSHQISNQEKLLKNLLCIKRWNRFAPIQSACG
jgi:hypothetical protein